MDIFFRIANPLLRFVSCFAFCCVTVFAEDFVVTSEADSGLGTLRAAMEMANDNEGSDTITFADDVELIKPTASLPFITDMTGGVTIDGNRRVVLDGGWKRFTGLELHSDDNVIEEMIVVNFRASGINLFNASNNVVRGCWIGTDGGLENVGNITGLTLVEACSNNLIGGPTPEDRNVISGNEEQGIQYWSGLVSDNVFEGNYIGTDVSGAGALGNVGPGIVANYGPRNIFRGNVVSANGDYGILIYHEYSPMTRVEGNVIGLNAAGTAPLPNRGVGLYVSGSGIAVGGTAPGAGNVISGNLGDGIQFQSTSENFVQGNIVGLGSDGVTPFGNGGHGIKLSGNGGVLVGGSDVGAGNTIAANANAGLFVWLNTANIVVQGNRIGTNAHGTAPAGTQRKGIFLSEAVDVLIGGETPFEGNVIAYHSELGIHATRENVRRLTIRKNAIHSNTGKGISFTFDANADAVAPVIDGIEPVSGTAVPDSTVEIFADSGDEGRILVDTVQATAGGTFGSNASLGLFAGLNLTATATSPDGSTSEFSAPVLIDVDIPFHTADRNGNEMLDLPEVMRVIQFYNSSGFACASVETSEDGYAPGYDSGAQHCPGHDADYDPRDWRIALSELLRVIQLYNSGGYHSCPDDEDGYCVGAA